MTDRLRYEIVGKLESIVHRLRHGCGNHGCFIAPPKGQATNGPCTCRPRRLIGELSDIAMDIAAENERNEPRASETAKD